MNTSRTRCPGPFGATIDTSISVGGTIAPNRMLKPCPNMIVLPFFMCGAISLAYVSPCE